jgi:hypothetical protein
MTTQTPDTMETLSQAAVDEAIDAIPVNHVDVIETVIDSLDSDNTAMVNQSTNGHLWKFKYGSAEVFVQLTGINDEDTLTVWSVVLSLPAKNEPQLMRKLLEMNWQETVEARFAIVDNQLVVVASRSVADMSAGEISRAVTIVATVADTHDDALQAEYGA